MTSEALAALRGLVGVVRAWPGRRGAVVLERRGDDGLLRAGRVGADGRVELADYAADPRLPELVPPPDGALVVHRLHRRAVVLCADRAVKLLRPGRARPLVAASRRLGGPCEGTGLRVARVLAATDARVELSLLAGRSLHELGDDGLDGWARLAEAWPRIAARPDLADSGHTGADEVAVLVRWLAAAGEHGALGRLDALRRAVERVCAELVASADPPALLHRDLHDGQLLWDGRELGVLDLDTVARGEAALDVGNLLAHAELGRLTGALGAPAHRRVRGHLAELAARTGARPARVDCYRRAARLRLALVHAFRPAADWWLPEWVEACLASAEPP